MSDENDLRKDTGRDAELSNAGYISITISDLKPPVDVIEDKPDALRAAADDLAASREREVPLKTSYSDPDPDKPDAFDLDAATEITTMARDQSAHDNIKPAQEAAEEALRDRIDEMRDVVPEREQLRQQDAEQQRQAEAQRYYDEQMALHEAKQANAHHASAEQQTQVRGQAAVGALLSEFPELNGLPLSAVAGAVEAIRARSPQRAQVLTQRLIAIDKLYGEHRAAQSQRAQFESQHHAVLVKNEADAFEKAIASDPPARKQAVFAAVPELLRNVGIDVAGFVRAAQQPNDLGRLHASSQVQQLLYQAAAAMHDSKSHSSAVADMKAKMAAANLPPVNAPGARGNGFHQPALSGAALNNKLANMINKGGDRGLREAAAALAASRRGGR